MLRAARTRPTFCVAVGTAERASLSTSGSARAASRAVEGVGRLVRITKRPAIGAALTAVEIVGTAVVLGAAETLVAVVAAYAVFRTMEQRRNEQSHGPERGADEER